MDLISWARARDKGLVHYCTGKPCPRGHLAARYVKGRSCVACAADDNYAARRSGVRSEIDKKHYWANRAAIMAKQVIYRQRRRDAAREANQ